MGEAKIPRDPWGNAYLVKVHASGGLALSAGPNGVIETPFVAGPLADGGTRRRLEGLTSFNRLGRPEEIAEAIAWLLSPQASYVHGATMVADGGMVMY